MDAGSEPSLGSAIHDLHDTELVIERGLDRSDQVRRPDEVEDADALEQGAMGLGVEKVEGDVAMDVLLDRLEQDLRGRRVEREHVAHVQEHDLSVGARGRVGRVVFGDAVALEAAQTVLEPAESARSVRDNVHAGVGERQALPDPHDEHAGDFHLLLGIGLDALPLVRAGNSTEDVDAHLGRLGDDEDE